MVADAKLRLPLPAKDPAPVAHVDHRVFRRALRLALEEVCYGRDGVELVGLVWVELQLHSRPRHTVLKLVTPLVLKV